MRKASYRRKTRETDIEVRIVIGGSGKARVATGIAFLDHMLETFALHGGFDLNVKIEGGMEVDKHHAVEDLGICLGNAIRNALGEKKGIQRAGFFIMPMDEALAAVAVDLCSRPFLRFDCPLVQAMVGELPTDLLHDFFWAFASSLAAAVHIKVEYGRSAHHQIEATFKALGRALKQACCIDPGVNKKIPSTKGIL